jgi:hypothetical protein
MASPDTSNDLFPDLWTGRPWTPIQRQMMQVYMDKCDAIRELDEWQAFLMEWLLLLAPTTPASDQLEIEEF